MPNTASFTKDPSDVLDYGFDWSDWLSVAETISTSSWSVQTGLTKTTDSKTTTTTTVWLSGGTAGVTYTVTNEITTNQGRTVDRSLVIYCQDR